MNLSLYIMSSCLRGYSVCYVLNTLDACWIAVDVWSNSSSAESIGLLVSDVMHICMIIALDIVMTLRGSINCSTVICSPTVILAILREASREHYGPEGLLHTIFSALHFLLRCTFRLQIPLCNQSWRDWQPLYSVGCKLFCVCAGTLDLTRFLMG